MVTKAQFYGVACIFVFIGILAACLWPFHSPRNQAAWLGQGNGVRFGAYGTIISRGALPPSTGPTRVDWTLEVWLQPAKAYQSDTILAFYDPQRPQGFSLRQQQTDLVVESRLWSKELHAEGQGFYVPGVFRRTRQLFLTLASGADGTRLYIDGNLVRVAPQFRLSGDDLSGQLVVANSPAENDGWSGELRGLALYRSELIPAQVRRHFTTWTQEGRPEESQDEGAVALYLFNENSGNIIHNQVTSDADLEIPERYLEVHQAFLKRPWNEYSSWDWESVLINVAGFVPLGFLLYGYLFLALRVRRAALITILIGGLLSLTVEILQAFLPTRDSGMTDIITNTLGTALGATLCFYASIVCERLTDSRHVELRCLAGLLARDGQEKRLTALERAWSGL
jgi:VanZ family protein